MVIYKITNLINGKCYIGQTSRTLEERWYDHCSKHSRCLALHSAIVKYGSENFLVEQIDTADTQIEADYKESMWIDCLETISPNGYNLKGGGSYGKHSDEVKTKMKEYWATHERTDAQKAAAKSLGTYHKGKSHSKEWNKKIGKSHEIQIDQYDLDGVLITTWSSLKEAADALNIPRGNICRVCKGERKTAHGFIWKYHDRMEVSSNAV